MCERSSCYHLLLFPRPFPRFLHVGLLVSLALQNLRTHTAEMAAIRIAVIPHDDFPRFETNTSGEEQKVKENSNSDPEDPTARPPSPVLPSESRFDYFVRVLQSEATQAKRNRIALATHWVFYAYFAEIVFRNMAFSRVNQAVAEGRMMPWRLLDVGHDLTTGAEWEAFGKKFAESPVYFLAAWVVFIPLLGHICRVKKPETWADLFSFYSVYMAIGHWLRFLCYCGTTLPGSAVHCTRETTSQFVEEVTPRSKLTDWMFKGAPGGNCGDLIFSGHIFLLLMLVRLGLPSTLALVPSEWRLAKLCKVAIFGAFFTLVCVQTLATLASRNHYTIDIVVAVMASMLIGDRVPLLLKAMKYKQASVKNDNVLIQAFWLFAGFSPFIHIGGRAVTHLAIMSGSAP